MGVLYLCGAGNAEGVRLAITVNRAESRWDRIILLDDDPNKLGQSLVGVEVAGPFALLAKADSGSDQVVNLVTAKTKSRAAVREKLAAYGIPFTSLIHPEVDTFSVELAEDVTVYQYAVLGAGSSVGGGSVILVRAIVGHRAKVGRDCVVAPGAVINARVVLSDRAYFGTNATILPDLTVGEDATVASLSSVIQDVPANATAIGVPAEIIHRVDTEQVVAHDDSVEVDPELVVALTGIWTSLLGIKKVGAHDNFFEVGGTSLLALKLRERVQATTGTVLNPVDMFRLPTIQAIAEHISRTESGNTKLSPGRKRGALRRQGRQRRPR